MLHTGSLSPHLGWSFTHWEAIPRSALLCDKCLPEIDVLDCVCMAPSGNSWSFCWIHRASGITGRISASAPIKFGTKFSTWGWLCTALKRTKKHI